MTHKEDGYPNVIYGVWHILLY